MNKKALLFGLMASMMLMATSAKAAQAGPHLTLNPATGTKSVGETIVVTIGVDSGAETSAAVEVFGTFDSTKFEVLSMEKVPDAEAAFAFVTETHFQNSTGKFDFACSPSNMSNFEDTAISGPLVKVIFRAKSSGVASVNFTCQAGSEADSNIFKTSGADVIDCASNQSGSYTINPGVGGDTTTATSTPTTAGELPKTGAVGTTMGLVAFGLVSLVSALFLRLI